MTERDLPLLGAVLFALPMLAIALIAFFVVARRLASGGFRTAARWARVGSFALVLHAVGSVSMRYLTDVVMPAASDLRIYATLVPLIGFASMGALVLALSAPLVAMLADRAPLANPSPERP